MRVYTSWPVRAVFALCAGLVISVTQVNAQGAADDLNQFELSEAQVQGFIGSQRDLAAIAEKLAKAGDKMTPKLQAELDGIALKNGFKDFNELDDVAANISLVLAGFDPETDKFTDPAQILKEELADVRADTSIPDDEKKQLIEQLNESIRSTPSLKFQRNVELVKKHRKAIEDALQ